VSVPEYLRSKTASLVIAAAGIASACLVAGVCGCPADAVTLIAVLLALCGLCACAIDHRHERRYYQNLKDIASALDRPYQLHSLIGEPSTPDHQIVFDALRSMGAASAQEAAQANAKATAHREFVEAWVHGVKAPLASCALIAERVAEPERSQLASELDRMARKVDAALWYARADCAVNDYAIREVRLAEICRSVCRTNARFLIEHGCIPAIDIDEATTVLADKKQVAFVITQLVENAAKYGASHVRFAEKRVGSRDGAGSIELRVEDDGWGIPAKDVSRVFERGFTGTRGREGTTSTGMGLYLAARLCEQLGLGLSLASVEGEGTCVTLSFPLDRRRMDASAARET
jgi:signal transduction histidine kinase